MIALSRALVKQFRLVARRALPAGRPRGLSPPVRIVAEPDFVGLTVRLPEVVVALRMPAESGGSGSLTLAMSDLERCEGAGSESVTLEAISETRGRASLRVRDIPTAFEFDLVASDLAWPEEPKDWQEMPAAFVGALHEAGRTCAADRGKYALDRIQVRGRSGQVIGSDVRHFLVQGGFDFPFTENLLVPAVPLFGAREFAREKIVRLGRAEDWLAVGIGLWRVWLKLDLVARYPDVFAVIPKSPGGRVLFDDRDAASLLEVFAALPRTEDDTPQVTLDVGRESVAVRLRPGGQGDVLNVPLPGSECLGPETVVVLNREHLGRALALGFREFQVSSPERPLFARDGERAFLMVSFDPKAALPRAAAASAVEETSPCVNCSPVPSPAPLRRTLVPPRSTSVPQVESNGSADLPPDAGFDPVAEAEGLRAALAQATTHATRLVGWLKHFRKERRALATAFAGLRQLNLTP